MSLLDHRVVSERYFFPRRDSPRSEWRVSVPDGAGEAVELGCVRTETGRDRWLLHFHGNGEVVADWEPLLPAFFAACGLSSVLVEYRGYGSSGGVPKAAAMLSDGEALLGALGLEPSRTVAFGRSIGSLYAVELARRLPLAGLILESGLHDLAERLLLRMHPSELGASEAEFGEAVAGDFDQGAKLAAFEGPTLLLHTLDDELVGHHHAAKNAAACRHPTLLSFEHGGHNGIFAANREAYEGAVRDFLASLA